MVEPCLSAVEYKSRIGRRREEKEKETEGFLEEGTEGASDGHYLSVYLDG